MKIIKSLFDYVTSSSLKSTSEKNVNEQWPQINAYHEIIAKTLKNKEVNIKEIKSNSKILVALADDLSVESMPEEFRNPKMIETLLSLKKNTLLVHELVENKASDVEIKAATDILYSIFHKLISLCITEKES